MINENYQFQQLLKHKNITHGVSSKAFESMKNVDTLKIDRIALAKFAKGLGIQDEIVCMKQIHSGSVVHIENSNQIVIAQTDSLITTKKHIPLAVLTADCLPLLFYDPKKEVIGIAHSGYKGLLNQIIEHTIERMVSDFKTDPRDLIVGIGPSIEMKCYEVGIELIEEFKKAFPQFENIFTQTDRNYYLDLRAVALKCLLKEGILKEHIEIMDICTKCDPNFYSYRRGDKDERFVSMISLI